MAPPRIIAPQSSNKISLPYGISFYIEIVHPEEPDGLWIMDFLDLRWIWIYKSKPHGFWMDLDTPKKSMRSMKSMKSMRSMNSDRRYKS